MKKNGFTLIELMATISIMGVLATMAVMSVSKFLDKTKNNVYLDYEDTLKEATANYFLNNTGLLPEKNDSTGKKILATTLISEGYLSNMADPKNNKLNCNNDSYVIATRNDDVDFNMDLEYRVCLVCSKYKSSSCK